MFLRMFDVYLLLLLLVTCSLVSRIVFLYQVVLGRVVRGREELLQQLLLLLLFNWNRLSQSERVVQLEVLALVLSVHD